MVAMGRALMLDPKLLLLDEPSAGLSPMLQDQVFLQCKQINETGVAILMVEQNARRCLQVCHRGYVLDQGRNAYTGTGRELLGDPKVIELYLGTLARNAMSAPAPRWVPRSQLGARRGRSSALRRRRSAATSALATTLCPTVQAWSDATVDAVDEFRIASRELDPAARRARYLQSFGDLAALGDRLGRRVRRPRAPAPASRRSLDEAVARVATVVADGAAEAGDLPDEAYSVVAVRDGSLVTGVEKAKAIVFNTLADLADEPGSAVPRGCGRRGALDLSPSVTFPP